MNIQYPDGTLPSPPYFERRLTMQIGDQSIDLMKAPNNPVWSETFSSGEVDWDGGWHALWEEASLSLGTGTDYSPGRVALEVQAYFSNGEMGSIGAAIDCNDDDFSAIDTAARQLIWRVCGGDEVEDGCIGLVTDIDDPWSRPCLTLLVTGPGGGAEAAMMVRSTLPQWNVNAGIAIRTIREGNVGVVKVPFLPELYLKVAHPCFGIRWDLWRALASHSASYEWNSSCLLWCNSVIECVGGLSLKAGLMIDDVYFDAMRVVPLSHEKIRAEIESEGVNIGNMLQSSPHAFLFGSDDA